MAPGDGFRLDGKLLDQLKAEAGSLASAARDRAVLSVRQNLGNAASRLARYAESGGGPGLMAAVTGVRATAGGRSSPRSGTAMRGAARRRAGGSSGPGGRHKGGQARKSPGRRRDAGPSRTTTDHEEIRRWVREHGGRPVSVKGTERRGEQAGILRVNFPGSPADESFKTIGWDTFFDKFEASQLAFVYQDATADGQQSRFGKLISRWRPR
jgi:hypothetical protein